MKFFIATLIPLALGGVIADKFSHWDTNLWLAILLASFLVHLNTNLANDYFEYYIGADEGDSIGGSRALQSGLIKPHEMRNAMILFYFIALLCGLWLLWKTRLWWLTGVMLFSFFSSVFYTAPPVKYGYHGLGELLVGINMGPIMTAGTASTLLGKISIEALWISIPIGIMVAFILYYQSISDIYDDAKVGKFTLAYRIGRNNVVYGFRIFAVSAVISIILLAACHIISVWGCLSVLTLTLLLNLDKKIRFEQDIHKLHDQGAPVRRFYLINGVILIAAVLTK